MLTLAADAHVLVVSVARIGDTLLATPALRALKRACPGGQLTVLAHPKRAEVLAHLPFIDRLGAIDKVRAPWRGRFGSPSHAAAIVFGREPALVQYALRVAERVVAYDEPQLEGHPRLTRVPVQHGTHAVTERMRLVEALGIHEEDRRLAYQVTAEERAAARARLLARWPRGSGLLVGLQMSSFPTKSHRDWPVENFCALAQRIVEQSDARFVVLGDPYARRMAEPFIQQHGSRTLLAAGETRLREAAALIAELDLYVGVDTGPTHIAGAIGVPMVALYHCQYPGRNLAPIGHPRCRVIEHPLTLDPRCAEQGMDAIGVETVWNAAAGLLEEGVAARLPA
jgi:heptosyltransferase-3